jgi:hypothetical protein
MRVDALMAEGPAAEPEPEDGILFDQAIDFAQPAA